MYTSTTINRYQYKLPTKDIGEQHLTIGYDTFNTISIAYNETFKTGSLWKKWFTCEFSTTCEEIKYTAIQVILGKIEYDIFADYLEDKLYNIVVTIDTPTTVEEVFNLLRNWNRSYYES